MPDASPALSRSSWLLLHYSGAVCTGAPSFLARSVSGTMVHLSWVVSLQWPFHFLSCLGYGSCFLCYLRYTGSLCVSSLPGYRSVLSAVFRFHLPSLSSDQVLRLLFRSYQLSSAECVIRPHTWDLSMVLPVLSHRPLSLCLRLTSALSR